MTLTDYVLDNWPADQAYWLDPDTFPGYGGDWVVILDDGTATYTPGAMTLFGHIDYGGGGAIRAVAVALDRSVVGDRALAGQTDPPYIAIYTTGTISRAILLRRLDPNLEDAAICGVVTMAPVAVTAGIGMVLRMTWPDDVWDISESAMFAPLIEIVDPGTPVDPDPGEAPLEPIPTPPLVGAPWWKIETLPWDWSEVLATHEVVRDIGFTDPPNDLGAGRLKLQNADPDVALFDNEHRVVRYSVLNLAASTVEAPVYKPLYAMLADRPKSTVIAEGEDADEVTAIGGRGALAQLAYSQVSAPGGDDLEPVVAQRSWNFGHSSIDIYAGNWTDATVRSVQGDPTALPPDGLAGLPWNFSNPLASWLSSRISAGADPDGVFLLAFDYELAAGSQLIFDATADDAFIVIANERVLGDVWDYPSGDAASDTWRGSSFFEAGTIRFRVAVANFPRGPEITNNCGLFTMAVSRPVDTDPGGYNEEWLFTTSTAGWRALDYADCIPVPGPQVGWVLEDLLTEAEARGELTWLGRSFNGTTDSGGVDWPALDGLVGFSVPIGTSYLQVLEKLRDAGWIEFDLTLDPTTGLPVLHAWSPLGAGEVRTDGLVRGNADGTGNLTALEFDIDHAGSATGALVLWSQGQTRIGTGPKTITISVDALTKDEAIAKATVILGKADTLKAVTAGITWSDQSAGPYFGWGKFDTVPAVSRAGEVIEARSMGFAVSADSATGRPVYSPMLEARRQQVEMRNARVLARVGLGAMAGRSSAAIPTTPRQRAMSKIDLITLHWSIPGTVEELKSGLVPAERMMRLNRMLFTSTRGTADTYLALVQDGVQLVGDGTIGVGEPVELHRSFLASVLRPNLRLQLLTGDGSATALGDHENLEIIGYGGPLGIQTEPTRPIR